MSVADEGVDCLSPFTNEKLLVERSSESRHVVTSLSGQD